jgi:hypothetical protein
MFVQCKKIFTGSRLTSVVNDWSSISFSLKRLYACMVVSSLLRRCVCARWSEIRFVLVRLHTVGSQSTV